MSSTSHLIEWKTSAWKDPSMVAWYSGRMVVNQGTNRLKNRLEVDLILAHATGQRILDVGIGTGRGSLPLAQRGHAITGVDSSQAMLDECQRLAREQGLAVVTQESSLDQLPFPDASFDSLVSLNVLMHFPNWKQILPEWARVVRPAGRLVFDVHSLDHYRVALGRPVTEADLLQTENRHYVLRIAAEDLVAEADRNGLAIIGLIPYGAFLGGGNRNYLLGPLEDRRSFSRLLSWMASDDGLFELALFLEQELVARLTTLVTGRFMAVLERRADPAGNRAWLERSRAVDEGLLRTPIDLGCIAARLSLPVDQWRRLSSGYIASSLRGRRLVECLCAELVASGRLRFCDLVNAPLDAWFCDLAKRRREDRIASELARSVPTQGAVAEALTYDGICLGDGLEYSLVERLLTRGLGRFSGVRS